MHIVTGGAGFIGSALVWKLNQMGIDDILVVDDLGFGEKWKNLVNRDFADYLHKATFLQLLEKGRLSGIDAILHMGACSSTTEQNAEYLMENNYRYTKILAEYCLQGSIRFIYAGSAATYGDGSLGFDDDPELLPRLKPLNMYGYSKQLFDAWAWRNNLLSRMVGLKFFNVFGPNEYHKGDMMSVVCKAFSQIQEKGRLRLFKSHRADYAHGEQKRDFIYVKDCVEVVWWLLQHPEVNGIFNLGQGRARSWNELAAAVFSAMDRPFAVDYIDMPESIRERYQYFTQANMSRLSALGCPIQGRRLSESVAEYVRGYLSREDPYL